MKTLLICTYLFITFCSIQSAEAVTIYLVRHAEKQVAAPNDNDPGLTEIGVARASMAGQILNDIQFTAIYSTDYERTQRTAEIIKGDRQQTVESYHPDKLNEFAEQLKTAPTDSTFLVVGHSNTTPDLAQALSGKPVAAMDESEYHHLFRVGVNADGSTNFDALVIPPISTGDK